jgi:electron transport complex protein RnfC
MISWKTASGYTKDALVIRMEGAFEKLGRREELFPWDGLEPFELRRIIGEYGLVEMEGAGRPLYDIFSSFQSVPAPLTLVVRCVFDDPWLAADRVLCRERLQAVVEGSVIAARAGRAERILYAFSQDERDLGARFLAEAENGGIPASLALVGSRYPQRNRRELELVLRSYEKREGLSLGALLILGPATLAAVHDAVKLRKPILDRYVAVGGSALRAPQVMKARIGTRIGDLFAECGGFSAKPKWIGAGSPFLGRELAGLDEPVDKTSCAVFALRKGRTGRELPRNCIGCGECRMVCPVGLDPEELFKRSAACQAGMETAVLPPPSADCHGCGCCELVCPSGIPLRSVISAGTRNPPRSQRRNPEPAADQGEP